MTTTTSQPPAAIILAAGKGTRMKSDLPKVVHLIGGRPMVCAVVDACLAVGCRKIVVIVGYQQEKVREALKGYDRDHHVEFAVQTEQLGTGHAVKCCAENFKAELQASKSSAGSSSNFASSSFGAPLPSSPCLVLCGDGPLIRPATLNRLLDRHQQSHAAASIATALLEDPAGYGRISRDAARKFKAATAASLATLPASSKPSSNKRTARPSNSRSARSTPATTASTCPNSSAPSTS